MRGGFLVLAALGVGFMLVGLVLMRRDLNASENELKEARAALSQARACTLENSNALYECRRWKMRRP